MPTIQKKKIDRDGGGGKLSRTTEGNGLTARIDSSLIDPTLAAPLVSPPTGKGGEKSSKSPPPSSEMSTLTARIVPTTVNQNPPDISNMSPEEAKAYQETLGLMAKLQQNIQEITGASVDPDLAQLTAPILSAKGKLTEGDLLTARITDPETANLLTAKITPQKGGLASFITGQALQEQMNSGAISRERTGPLSRFREVVVRETAERLQSTLGVTFRGDSLHPTLLNAMAKNPKIADYVTYTFAAAKNQGIDPYLLANQLWRESNYNPNAISYKGALGIGQFMPKDHVGKWGIRSIDDLSDAYRSIDAAAWHMRHLTQKFGNQVLALAAYNGGPDAVYTANRALGVKNISVSDWLDVMEYRRRTQGTGNRDTWHVQTYDYIMKITEWSGVDPRAFEATQSILGQSTRLTPTDTPSPKPR